MSQYLNILVAYPYMSRSVIKALKEIHDELGDNFRFLLDSGAFTAYSSGKEIKLDDYCKFLDNLPFKPWNYFALDVIGNPEATAKNYKIMLERGYKPAPVFTFGDNLSIIDEYYKTSDFIGIGGLVGVPANTMLNAVNDALKVVNGRPAHLLGFTRVEYLKLLKPYSCDSSSWEGGARFGFFEVYNKGKLIKFQRKDVTKKPKKEILNILKRYRPNVSDFARKESWTGGNSVIRNTSARAWSELSIEIEKNIGTKLFLACATDLALNLIYKGYKNAIQRR